jgi:hypothetical protein
MTTSSPPTRFGIPCMTEHDVFTVERQAGSAGLAFHVTHFRTATTRAPCCDVDITQQAGESDLDTLRRAARAIETNHGRTS